MRRARGGPRPRRHAQPWPVASPPALSPPPRCDAPPTATPRRSPACLSVTPRSTAPERVNRALRRALGRPNTKVQLLALMCLEALTRNAPPAYAACLAASELWADVLRLAEAERRVRRAAPAPLRLKATPTSF